MDYLTPTNAALFVLIAGAAITAKVLRIGRRDPDLPPGPKPVPIFGNLLDFPSSRPYEVFSKWSRVYGDIFCFKNADENLMLLTSPAVCRELLLNHVTVTSDRPPNYICEVITDGLHLPFMPQGPVWKILRRTARDILSPQACARHIAIQKAESARLMYDMLRKPEDHYTHYLRYALSVIMSVTFGQSVVDYDSPFARTFIDNAHDFNHIMGIGQTPPLDLLPILRYVPERWAPWKTACRSLRARHKEFYWKLLKPCQDRAANGLETRSFMQSVCERMEEMGMTPEMTLVLGQAILETGYDTSAAYLQNATLLLLAHPEVQAKAHEELDRVIGFDRCPTPEDVENLPYIRAIIEEYKGYRIPAKSVLLPNLYGVFEDGAIYDHPEKFDPDRYLAHPYGVKKGVDPTDAATLKDFVFGFGKRSCPGMILAKNTIALNMSNLLWAYDILKPIGSDGRPIEPDLNAIKPQLVYVTPPFQAVIRPRSARHAEIVCQNFVDYTNACAPFEEELTEQDRKFVTNLRMQAAQGAKQEILVA
ncbi:hypothetical protein FRB99_005302 [Tulasnella sp. 403]|nr:hypothetical protein FRB99_005302 [Tulasnella sp. 403]